MPRACLVLAQIRRSACQSSFMKNRNLQLHPDGTKDGRRTDGRTDDENDDERRRRQATTTDDDYDERRRRTTTTTTDDDDDTCANPRNAPPRRRRTTTTTTTTNDDDERRQRRRRRRTTTTTHVPILETPPHGGRTDGRTTDDGRPTSDFSCRRNPPKERTS